MPTIAFTLLWNVGLTTVVAILVGLLSRSKPLRHRPTLTHSLWLLVLAKLITPPLIPLPVLPGLKAERADVGSEPSPLGQERTEGDHVAWSQPATTDERTAIDKSFTNPLWSTSWSAILVGIAGCGTFILISASFTQLWRISRILRRAPSGDVRLNGLARSAASRLGMQGIPDVCAVDASITPLLWVRPSGPVLVMPTSLTERMSDEQITCIFCHELAHYVRRDHWSNAFAFLVAALFWWHPVAWWARREMRSLQEVCCDGLVLATGVATRRCYAETLFQALEFVQTNRPFQPSLVNGFGTTCSLKRRFEMIGGLNLNHRFSWWAASLVAACFVSMFCIPVRGQPAAADQEQPAKATAAPEPPFDYAAPITVSGRALDVEHKPISGATVYLTSVGAVPKRLAETKSDDKGNYAFRDVKLPIQSARPGQSRDVGAFEVFGTAMGLGFGWRPQKWFYPFPLPVGAVDLPGEPDPKAEPHGFEAGDTISLDLTLRPADHLAGRVVDDRGRPLPQAKLRIYDCEPLVAGTDFRFSTLNARNSAPPELNTRVTDADGRFDFTGLPPECRFRILVQPKDYPVRWIWAATTRMPQADYGPAPVLTGDLQLTFAAPVEVPFRVVFGDSKKPAAKVLVTLDSSNATAAEETDGEGRVSLRVPAGEYHFSVIPAHGMPYLESLDKLVVGKTPPAETIVGQLRAAGIIEVRVVDKDTGAAIEGVDFWLQRGDGTREGYFYRWWTKPVVDFVRPHSDKNGKLRVLIEPGKHRIGIGLESHVDGFSVIETDGLDADAWPGKPAEVKFTMRLR